MAWVGSDEARDIGELSAALHATTADLVGRLAAFDASEGWRGEGITSCTQWLSVYAGFDYHHARQLLDVGHALRELPELSAAFSAGELSLGKVRAVCQVATPPDDGMWTEVARQATASQLQRIVQGYRQASVVSSDALATSQREQRRLTTAWQPDGMLRLVALLPPEDGAIVQAALDAASGRMVAESPEAQADDREVHRLDALVELCHREVAAHEGDAPAAMVSTLMVHVDAALLTGETDQGRCHLQAGPSLSLQAAQRLGCDATVVVVVEKDGLPINMGRARRLVSRPLRRALHVRDRTCTFPGCNVPARRTHAHHVKHWAAHGGNTDADNLILLCSYHHHRVHDGTISAEWGPENRPMFRTSAGAVIGPVRVGSDEIAVTRQPFRWAVTADTAAARDGTPMNLHWVVGALFDGSASAALERAGPGPPT